MEGTKKGAVSKIGGGVKVRSCGADEAMANMVKTSEFIPRALGSHWKVLGKQTRERENFDLSNMKIVT